MQKATVKIDVARSTKNYHHRDLSASQIKKLTRGYEEPVKEN